MAILKKLALLGSGLTFTFIALAAIFWPETVARAYGFTIARTDVDAMNELRAMYVGFWACLAGIYFRALKDDRLAKVGAALLISQAGGRVVSLLLDGVPGIPHLVAMSAELFGGVLILLGLRNKA